MHTIKATVISSLLAFGCSSADEHPPQLPPSKQVNASGHGGKIAQPLTGCVAPFPYFHTVTNWFVQSTPADASCPAAWYSNFDPMSWRAGKIPGGAQPSPPTVPLGQCAWTPFHNWDGSCSFWMEFTCPNGIYYHGFMFADSKDWKLAHIDILADEPGCRRRLFGAFNAAVAP